MLITIFSTQKFSTKIFRLEKNNFVLESLKIIILANDLIKFQLTRRSSPSRLQTCSLITELCLLHSLKSRFTTFWETPGAHSLWGTGATRLNAPITEGPPAQTSQLPVPGKMLSPPKLTLRYIPLTFIDILYVKVWS